MTWPIRPAFFGLELVYEHTHDDAQDSAGQYWCGHHQAFLRRV